MVVANGKYYQLTLHSEVKMRDLDMSEQGIAAVLEGNKPDISHSSGDDIYFMEYQGKRIAVVVIEEPRNGFDGRIRTVYEVK